MYEIHHLKETYHLYVMFVTIINHAHLVSHILCFFRIASISYRFRQIGSRFVKIGDSSLLVEQFNKWTLSKEFKGLEKRFLNVSVEDSYEHGASELQVLVHV